MPTNTFDGLPGRRCHIDTPARPRESPPVGRKGKSSKSKRSKKAVAPAPKETEAVSTEEAAGPAETGTASEGHTPAARRRITMLIGAFLLLQLAVPLTYYFRDNPYDERFAWRMFSAIRLQRCRASAWQTSAAGRETLNLSRVTHQAWINILQRNREDVIEAFLDRRCEEPGVEAVTLRNDCASPTGERAAFEYSESCDTGEITWPEHGAFDGAEQ